MKGFNVDYINKKIILTKAFAKALNDINSEEFKTYCYITDRFPSFEIMGRTHRSPKNPNKNKRLTYENMERYISAYDNAPELLETFSKVKELALAQTSSYHYVREWFVSQFPNYKEVPQLTNGKLISHPLALNAIA